MRPYEENTYHLGTPTFLHFQNNPLLNKIQNTLAYFPHHILLEEILLIIMNNSSIALNNTKNSPTSHAYEREAPHSNFVLNHLGNYIQNHPCSLTPMAKRHTHLLIMIIKTIPITLPSYLYGVQMLNSNQYSQCMSYINVLQICIQSRKT